MRELVELTPVFRRRGLDLIEIDVLDIVDGKPAVVRTSAMRREAWNRTLSAANALDEEMRAADAAAARKVVALPARRRQPRALV